MAYTEVGEPTRIDALVTSWQHDDNVTNEQLHAEIEEHVIRAVIPANLLDSETKFHINRTGRFAIAAPWATTASPAAKSSPTPTAA